MRRALIGLFCVVLLPACAPAAPPPPIEVTRVVTVEVAREVGIPVEVTRLVVVTASPRASATPLPTHPAISSAIAAAVEGPLQPTCWSWREAGERVGASGCVEGTVTGTGESDAAFFINFSEERNSFYLVSFDWRWAGLEGRCVRVDGTISTFRDRPQMIVNDPETVRECAGDELEVVPR